MSKDPVRDRMSRSQRIEQTARDLLAVLDEDPDGDTEQRLSQAIEALRKELP